MGDNVYKNIARGSVWALMMRWGIRGLGLINMMILARLLTPADFGLVAMATLTMGLLEIFAEMGVGTLLIREREITGDDIDTAWTMNIIQGLVVAAIIVVAAPLAARYYGEPRLLAVMQVLALSSLMQGLTSIGITLARKRLDFAVDFRNGIYERLFKMLTTIPAALALGDYWAIVIGNIAGTAMSVVLSYAMCWHRPRFCLKRARKFVRFSVAIISTNIARFFANKIDVLVVSSLADPARFGLYNVASETAKMFTGEITAPIGRALLPSYARISHDRQQLASAYLHMLTTMLILVAPLTLGLFATAPDFVAVVLGDKWMGAVPVLRWLPFYALGQGLMQALTGYVFVVAGQEYLGARLRWIQLLITGPTVTAAALLKGVEVVPLAATVSIAIYIPIVTRGVSRVIPVTLAQQIEAVWRPCLAAILMVVAVRACYIADIAPLWRLLWSVAVGATAYLTVLIALWMLAGKPQGPEHALASILVSRFDRKTTGA